MAPILIVPRIFEPELCLRLVELFEACAAKADPQHRSVPVEDADLRRLVVARIDRNLAPMVARALQFRPTRLGGHVVTRTRAGEQPSESKDAEPIRLACRINLGAESFEGGDLRFPDFGSRTYQAPTGGALVFSLGLRHETTPVVHGGRYAYESVLSDVAGSR